MLSGWSKVTKFVGDAFAKDVSKFVNPMHEHESVIGGAVRVVDELNALAEHRPLPPVGPLEDNRDINLLDAQLEQEFAFGERLASDLAYRDISQQQLIIPLLEEDHTVRHYEMIKLATGHNGIEGNILIPYSHPDLLRVYVNFSGTMPTSFASLHLNLEHLAGEESFHRHFHVIMDQINNIIGQVSGPEKKPVEVVFSGHSLGGALSIYCFNAAMLLAALKLRSDLIKEGVDIETQDLIETQQRNLNAHLSKHYKLKTPVVKHEDYANFANIGTFKNYTWGAAGISSVVESCTNQLADILMVNGKYVVGRFGMNVLDIVPKTGEAGPLTLCKADVAYMLVEDQSLDVSKSLVAGGIKALSTKLILGGVWGALLGGATLLVEGLRPMTLAHTDKNFGSTGERRAGKKYKILLSKIAPGDDDIAILPHGRLLAFQHPAVLKIKSTLLQLANAGSHVKESAKKAAVKQIARAKAKHH